MIFDDLDCLKALNIPEVDECIRIAHTPGFAESEGMHTTDIPGIAYNVLKYTTQVEKQYFEVHRHTIDLHLMLTGSECIDSASRALTEKAGEYHKEDDFALVEGPSNNRAYMKSGSAALYFPGEPHKPGISSGKEQEIYKVVFKISTEKKREKR